MRCEHVRHDYLRKYFEELSLDDNEKDFEIFNKIFEEIKHSNLIISGEAVNNLLQFNGIELEGENFGFLFTDMDEFRKYYPNYESDSLFLDFAMYHHIVCEGIVDGFIINPDSECFFLPRELILEFTDFPELEYNADNSFSACELKSLKESINNTDLEEFLTNSSNIGKYEELFELISNSTILTLMLSREDLSGYANDDVICRLETDSVGFLYIDNLGGRYATIYSSESKIKNVSTSYNKYSQIVNFSQMTNFILFNDMDGIIINPNSENILLTRDVLLKYSSQLEKTCNDSRLNSGIFHMFLFDET